MVDHLNVRMDCVVKGCKTKFRTVRAMCGHIKVVHRELSKEEKKKYVLAAKEIPLPDVNQV